MLAETDNIVYFFFFDFTQLTHDDPWKCAPAGNREITTPTSVRYVAFFFEICAVYFYIVQCQLVV